MCVLWHRLALGLWVAVSSCVGKPLQPQPNGREHDHRQVVHAKLLVTGRHATELLQPVDRTFDDVSRPVQDAIEQHILTELSDVCTSIGILERGRLVVAGPIGEIAQRLEALRVAEAHGHAPPALDASGARGAPAPLPPEAAPRRKVKVRVLGDPELAATLVRGGPGIVESGVVAGVVHVSYLGNDARIAEIVQRLVAGGVGVVGVEPERNELERIFLEVTRGDMQ